MKPYFRAIYSTLSAEALTTLVAEKYKLENIQCRFLTRGVGDTYLVQSPNEQFILRIYRDTHRSLPQIKEELSLLLALKDAGVSVSWPIQDHSGTHIQPLQAIEGIRHAVLFSYAPGTAVSMLNDQQLRNFGREMARFHNVSSALSPETSRWSFDTETTLFKPLRMLQTVKTQDPETYAWLQQTAQRAQEKLSQTDTSGFSKGYCHFDFIPKNFHFDGDAVTLFDFDFMGYGWLVNDIMSFWQHLMFDVYAGRATQQASDDAYAVFLEGYREHRAVSDHELAMAPCLTLGFWLFYMGFHTTHDHFYTFTQPAYVKMFTGFLKHVVNTWWDKEENQ